MNITQSTMDRIHDIQYDMLKELIRVMDVLKINYYFVHGSLLGAIRDHDFIAEDDDIDIAIFRREYNKLMLEGNALLGEDLFLQNSANDKYPLPFAKLRKQDTAFIQPVLKHTKCNQGIYIDIFPIDYEPSRKTTRFQLRLLDRRISTIFPNPTNSLKNRIMNIIAKSYCFSYDSALLKREILLSSQEERNTLCIHGGKTTEKLMPIEWFQNYIEVPFRDITVKCPIDYAKYLSRIYGADYINHNPATKRITEKQIEISAEILDFKKSYLEYQ